MILIDNYDSFTYNIVQYLRELGVNPIIFKNDEITIPELKKLNFSSIIISPGPGNPDDAGISVDIIGEFYKTKKILGVCLGHQCIAQYFGCKIIKAKEPVHGKVSEIYFSCKCNIFDGLKQGFKATRYHSLVVDNNSLPECLEPLAYTEVKSKKQRKRRQGDKKTRCVEEQSENYAFTLLRIYASDNLSPSSHLSPLTSHSSLLMALKHKDYPVYGVQFHPEAILTQGGKQLIKNFISLN
ncbi:MAG: aminodeoxychorismate/anthranilate synthase component II [Candidatus Gastranaerophilales bacterium]|nr:aminodeoxychorismate/anthranilate synthase component II [Candidatus Gastranaerophilales bacterium]